MDRHTRLGLLKEYVKWANEQEFCEQCVRPWIDEECTCGNSQNPRLILALETFDKLHKHAISKGIDEVEFCKIINKI